MSLTESQLREHSCSPLRSHNVDLAVGWINQQPLSVAHGPRYSLVRFPQCANRMDQTDGGFAAKVSDDGITLVCFHEKCQGHDWEASLGPCPIQSEAWIIPFPEFKKQHSTPRPAVIEGVVYQGDTMNIIAPTKLGKSFYMAQKGLSVAAGKPWFGKPTIAGRVLIIDNELHRDTITYRIERVREALGIDESVYDNLDIAALRGNLIGLDKLCERINRLPKHSYSLIILDALYRMTPEGTDENGNSPMRDVYNMLDKAATAHGCAFAVVHHTSKGDQSKKAVTDVGSGAGSQSRAADCHLVMRPHKSPGCVVMEAAIRACPPMTPVVLRREFPLWVVAEDADPSAFRTSRPDFTVDEFNEWLQPGDYIIKDLLKLLRDEKRLMVKDAEAVLEEALAEGVVERLDIPKNQKQQVRKAA